VQPTALNVYILRDEEFSTSNKGFVSDDRSTGATEGSERQAAAGSGLKSVADGSRVV